MDARLSYIDFAENDYRYLKQSYEMGLIANTMASQAQMICEKYMKEIIDKKYIPVNDTQMQYKDRTMITHNLQPLITFLRDEFDITIPKETLSLLRQINGYFFTTRYPTDDSIIVDKEDIDLCMEAVDSFRTFIFSVYKDFGLIEEAEEEKEL